MLASSKQLPRVTPLESLVQYRWLLAFAAPIVLAPLCLLTSASFNGLLQVLLLGTATVTDLSGRKIYNWTTYTAFAWAIALSVLISPSTPQAGSIGPSNCLAGAGLCFLLMLVPYSLARGGAGDVKLATAIGALVGTGDGLLVIAFTYIIAGASIAAWTIWTQGPLTLCTAMLRRFGAMLFPNRIAAPTEGQAVLLDKPIPLAGFFAIGTLCVVFDLPAVLRSL